MTDIDIPTMRPPHPGRSILEDCIAPLGLTITEAASHLHISRPMLSRVINGRSSITAEMALRLTQAFGGSAQTWLSLQLIHDLWHAREKHDQPIQRLVMPADL